MKKTATLLLVSALYAAGANAQALFGYTPEVTHGTYTALDSPTLIYDASVEGSALADEIESKVFAPGGIVTEAGEVTGYGIGFSFPYAGKEMTSFAVSGTGSIMLGGEKVTVNPSAGGNFNTYSGITDALGCIPNRGARGMENTLISYKTTDEALVIQFENLGMMTGFWGDPTAFNMQVRLGKDGSVAFVYDNFKVFGEDNIMFTCSLRQNNDYICAGGTLGEEITLSFNSSELLTAPPVDESGITLTFLAPGKCTAPAAQPADLKLTATSTSVNCEFTAAEGADNYLAIRSTDADFSFEPVDGTIYSTQDELEGMEVAYYGTETTFENIDLAGGTTYYYKVYAVKAFGLEGPAYNKTAPLSGSIATLPAGCEASLKSCGTDSVTISVTANEAGDDVVVLYTTYCERDNFGDHGLFGVPTAGLKVGDKLPVPEGYENMIIGLPAPEDGGTVAYIGAASDEIVISGLEASTGYFFGVYSRNKAEAYTTEAVYFDAATTILPPYDGNSDNFPRYTMPQGWTTSEDNAEARTASFHDEVFQNFREGTVSQGTQFIQQRVRLQRGNAEGITSWLSPQPIEVNDRHIMARFSIALTESSNRFDTHAYNTWAEGDRIEILASADNGETWESILTLTPENKPEFRYDTELGVPTYTTIEADLNSYRGKTVRLKLQWLTYTTASWGASMFLDRFSLEQGDFPEVPEVSMGTVTSTTAVVNWKSTQTDYQLAYAEKDAGTETTVDVKGAMTYKIDNLTPLTGYRVRVRGVLEGAEGKAAYTEWSDAVTFSTLDWPAVEAPTGLESNLDSYPTDCSALLKWTATEEMESFEVAYRESSATSWEYIKSTEPSCTLPDLKAETKYVWKVRAFCTHDRTTEYSAQANFTTPKDLTGIDALLSEEDAEFYTTTGVKVNAKELVPGTYIVRTKNGTHKVMVK